MNLLSWALFLGIAAICAQLWLSYIFSGWVAKYTSPPYSFDDIPDLTGKVAIVTGTNTGIGYVTARELARHGAHVVATARSKSRGTAAIAKMKAEIAEKNGSQSIAKIDLMVLDLASLASVRAFVDEFKATGLDIDILILNAGIMMAPFGKTVDGFESQMGVNHLGHFFLVKLLLPLILGSNKPEPCRVVHVSSAAHEITHFSGMRFDNFDNDHQYNEVLQYGQSKLANILFSNELSKRYHLASVSAEGKLQRRINSNSLHPGTIHTELMRHVDSYFHRFWGLRTLEPIFYRLAQQSILMTADDGALTQLFVATSPKVADVSGKYFVPIGIERHPSSHGTNETLQAMLWDVSERLIAPFV